MPLYEYECKKCGHRFEEIKKFSDKPPKKCPECGGAIEQVISAPAVQFKGSGWYVTDYAKRGSGSTGTSSASNSSDSESSSKESTATNEAKDGKGGKKEEKTKSESSSKKHKKD